MLNSILTCALCGLRTALFLVIIQRCIQGWHNNYHFPFMLVRMWAPIFRCQWWYILGGNWAEERYETRGNKSVKYYWAEATQRSILKVNIDSTLSFTLYTYSCISSQNHLVNIQQAKMLLASADFHYQLLLNRTRLWGI